MTDEEKIDDFFAKTTSRSQSRSQQLMIVLRLADVLQKKLDQGFSKASLHKMLQSEFGFTCSYQTFCKMLQKHGIDKKVPETEKE